jgi:wyosine [tRNA(Phe)-imidazoG37] synthetase (radical SAM superfamily)
VTSIPVIRKQQIIFPDKSLQGKYCLSPFVMIEVGLNGDVRLCGCGSWMPAVVGNLTESTLTEILSSELAQKIRQSIIDGTYHYCNANYCGILTNNELNDIDTVPENVKQLFADSTQFEMPHWIHIQGDNVCNLSCPSCRTGIIKPKAEEVAHRENLGKIISENLFSQNSDRKIVVHTSGSGEVFASPLLMNLLSSIDLARFPNFKLCLQSNGLMAEKNWHRISHLESTIQHVTISIDAATADTYQVVRRGGTWKQLNSAMKFLQTKKHQLGFELRTRMVVQDRNIDEIYKFYEFCKSYDVDRIEYSKVTDWQSWSADEFNQHNVFDKSHKNYQKTKDEIARVQNLPGVWCHGIF